MSPKPPAQQRWVLKLDFLGANPGVRPRGEQRSPATFSYFRGKREEWKTGLKTYTRVVYSNLWPGIDLVYSGNTGQLKYTFTVRPGADPHRIRLRYRGATGMRLTEAGRLAVTTPVGGLEDAAPSAYQEIGAKQHKVAVDYRLEAEHGAKGRRYGFRVGSYDPSKPLVIDPTVLIYAGFIGGAARDEGTGIAVDRAGNAYVVGTTDSDQSTFPVTAGPDATFNGGIGSDAFVAKVDSSGTALVYCGYIGGSGQDEGHGIAVDMAGNAYVTGGTSSTQSTFPAVGGPDLTFNGGISEVFPSDAFVAKVNAAGTALVYCGYLGGRSDDIGTGIAVDTTGNAYITGETSSTQSTFPAVAGPGLTFNGDIDAFVAKVNAAGTALVYCGYIGGADFDQGLGIAVDSAGNAYVTGGTDSTQSTFPVVGGPDLTFNARGDAFVAKVNPTGTSLVYCGYIGGGNGDIGTGVAVDGDGNAYVTGHTSSTGSTFPVTGGPDRTYNGGISDAFVAKVNAAGTALVYCGYIGGSGLDEGRGIAVDRAGNAYVTGLTTSTERTFPIPNGPDPTFNGGEFDAFVAKIGAFGLEALTLSPSTVPGCRNATGTVSLNGFSPTNTLVTLTSASPALASVPATLMIPAGTLNRDFTITTPPVSSSQTVEIQASFGEGLDQSATLMVRPIGVQAVTLSPNPVVGGTRVTGQFSLECPAAPSSISVSIAGDTAVTDVNPATLIVPAGAAGGTFTVGTDFVGSSTTVPIHVTANGVDAGVMLQLIPERPTGPGFLTGLTLTPTRVVGGFPTRGRVSWNHPVSAASGARIALSSSDPNLAVVPESITILHGATSMEFLIRTQGVRSPVSVAITATRDGVVATQALQIVPLGFRGPVLGP